MNILKHETEETKKKILVVVALEGLSSCFRSSLSLFGMDQHGI